MLKKLFALLLMSSLGLCKAEDTTGYIETDAFISAPAEYKHELSTPKLIIRNVPRIRTQGPLPVCYGCSAATIVQKYLCDNHPNYTGRNCSKLSPTMEVSVFDLTSWSLTNRDGQSTDLPSNHKNIRIKNEDRRKTEGVLALLNSRSTPAYLAESCSTSAILKKSDTTDAAREVDLILARLESYHSQLITNPNAKCDKCHQHFIKAFESNVDFARFNLAFEKKTFGEVLYQLVFSEDCDDKIAMRDWGYKVGLFPLNEPSNRSDLIGVILSAMGSEEKNRPVLLGNICLLIQPDENKCLTHSLVVSGYKYLCKRPNLNSNYSDCLLMMKVHNCWGEEWQRNYDDGWVVATSLVKNVNRSLPKLNDGAVSWIK